MKLTHLDNKEGPTSIQSTYKAKAAFERARLAIITILNANREQLSVRGLACPNFVRCTWAAWCSFAAPA